MNLYRYNFTRLWNWMKRTPLRSFIQTERDLPLALDLWRGLVSLPKATQRDIARNILGLPVLAGAMYGNESRRWLTKSSVETTTIDTSGANSANFNVFDYFMVDLIGVYWTVAGTVTALVMDFDKYPRLNAAGTVVDKLDGTNGTITAPTVAGQAIGNILYKDLQSLGPVKLVPGQSVQAIVTTTTTAGEVLPFIQGWPTSERLLNLSTAVASS